jgi:hypothetical protein
MKRPYRSSKIPKQTRRELWKSLVAEPLNVRHYDPPTLLEFTFGEILYDPFNSNKTRITRVWKCSRRVCLMHQLNCKDDYLLAEFNRAGRMAVCSQRKSEGRMKKHHTLPSLVPHQTERPNRPIEGLLNPNGHKNVKGLPRKDRPGLLLAALPQH